MLLQIDNVINGINKKSTFRVIAFLVLSFPTFQNYSQLQNILLALVTPAHNCQTMSPQSYPLISNDQCSFSINGSQFDCLHWEFSSEPVGKTMVSDYNLVCSKKGYGDMIMIVWYITSITLPLAGWLSDVYGRKQITICYLLLETVSSILLAFSSNVFNNILLRFLLGISSGGVTIAYVWCMESVDVKFRHFVASFFWAYGCFAYIVSPFITYVTKNWRYTQLVSIIPSLFYLSFFLVPESPRWLLIVGQRKKAFESIKTIAFINSIKLRLKKDDIAVTHTVNAVNLRSTLNSPVFLYRLLMAVFLQLSVTLFYSAVAINITILSSNIYVSMFLLGVMETPSMFISFFSFPYLKRKTSLLLFGGLGSSLFWLSVFLDNDVYWQSVLRIVIGCIAKSAICCVGQNTMIYIAELLPTSHRSFGLVCSQFFNFIAFIGAIYINKLSAKYFFLPMTIYLLFMNVAYVLVYYTLPETKGLPFPDTLQDQHMLVINREEEYVRYMKEKYLVEECADNDEEDWMMDNSGEDNISLLTNRIEKGTF